MTGEGQENTESSFDVLKEVNLPRDTFGLLDMCDSIKDVLVSERMIIHFKYGDQPLSCIKIFRSDLGSKSLGLRYTNHNYLYNLKLFLIYLLYLCMYIEDYYS